MTKILHVLQIVSNYDKSSKNIVNGRQQSQKVYRHSKQYVTFARGLQVVIGFFQIYNCYRMVVRT